MTSLIRGICAMLLVALVAAPVAAQQTTGTITGRVTDEQGAAIPGVTVTATQAATGFTRSDTSDTEGLYRLAGLPVGVYALTTEIAGFSKIDRKDLIVTVGQTLPVDLTLKLASVQENVVVTGESPLIETSASSVGASVDVQRLENLPLNGRQFANAAATVPGVILGFHSDPTKSTQFSPQIGGGNGRNLNYQIDGGDNNDDTVGGLLQLFPLEAVQEFNFVTSRYKAEYGRSNGGVMNIVTKSGTNDFRGSWFTLLRDDALNAKTETEKRNNAEKQKYRRYQYGGSVGGPLMQDKAHFFGAAERTQQKTFQIVNTQGLFPEFDGEHPTPYSENLVTGKVTTNVTPSQYLAVRYGRNNNSQPYGAGPNFAPNNWGTSTNEFNSINLNHNWVLGGSKLNEFIFQYADFVNHISANSGDIQHTFLNGVRIGQNTNTPQSTEQKKWQFKDDFSWNQSGWGGLGHDFKVGVNFIHEPHLFLTFTEGTNEYAYAHGDNTIGGIITGVSINGGLAEANIPLDQFAFYFQDDWRLNSRLTLNLGVRYDYIDGYQIDQSRNPNFVKVQAAGRAGLLQGIKGLENFGKDPKNDTNNWQPRVGFVYDLAGNGRTVLRGGVGVYYDMGYTNSNVLFPAVDATGIGFGSVFNVSDPGGICNVPKVGNVCPGDNFYRFGQPVSNIAFQNQSNPNALPLFGQFIDPLLEMPYTVQYSAGVSRELMPNTVLTVDFVRNNGYDLNARPRINTRPLNSTSSTPRRLQFLQLQPNALGTRPAVSRGSSEYTALITGLRRRMSNGLDFTATYTLGKAESNIGTAVDELNSNNLQNAELLYDDPQAWGPTARTDARHSGTIGAIIQMKGMTIAPIFTFRSPLPLSLTQGQDRNLNSENNDLPDRAYAFDGFNDDDTAKFKELGACENWNCGRGAWRTQLNLRVSYGFRLVGTTRLEAIGEVFNLLHAKNPGGFRTTQFTTAGVQQPLFMQPSSFAGDFQAGEQRVGQLGFRFTF